LILVNLSTEILNLAIARFKSYNYPGMDKFGPYLKQLRKQKGLTLKQVEKAARISNSFLSQVERGIRKPPRPDMLNRLAAVYGVPVQDLLETAGYITRNTKERTERDRIERAYEHVITDPHYSQGTRMKGITLSLEAKKFIVEMYEKATNRSLLKEE
jgi:HTH-type transcriptional regulator, competence development regulator